MMETKKGPPPEFISVFTCKVAFVIAVAFYFLQQYNTEIPEHKKMEHLTKCSYLQWRQDAYNFSPMPHVDVYYYTVFCAIL